MKKTLLAFLSLLVAAGSIAAPFDFNKEISSPECRAWVDSVYNTLSPRERVAQLFCPVVDPKQGTKAKALIKSYVGDARCGGLLLRGGSLDQYIEMTDYAQAQAGALPVMMTLDGEWGPAMRVPEAPKFPYNMALGAISDMELIEEYGREVARQCRVLGMHVDFAPVADVNLNPDNPVIGRRSLGENPERVADAVVAFSRGMEQAGVLTTAKHFPGHGDTSTDSHKTLPVVDHSREFMKKNDLVPFERYINAGLSGIMVGHLSVPSLDPSGTPASMSHAISTGVLKDQMGFKGLVFTDALEMKGTQGTQGNKCVQAFKAGADMLLSSSNPPQDIIALQKAAESGEVDRKRVEAVCRKVLAYKWALGLRDSIAPHSSVSDVQRQLNGGAAQSLIERLTAASATVTGNAHGILPIKTGKSIAVVTLGDKAENEFTAVASRHLPVDTYSDAAAPLSADKIAEIMGHDVVIALVCNDGANAIQQLDRLKEHRALVPVMMMTPYKAMKFKEALTRSAAMVMMYDDNAVARRVAADAVMGGNDVSGRLPVSMPGVAAIGEGVTYPACRLSFSTPHATGMAGWLADSVGTIAREGVAGGAFPGVQVLVVKNGKVIVDCNEGRVNTDRKSARVTPETIYDIASVTKIAGTLPGIMVARDRGLIDLNATAASYIPGLRGTGKDSITVADLLYHRSGMPASLNMYDIMVDTASYEGNLFRGRRDKAHTLRVGRNTWIHRDARLRSDILREERSDSFPRAVARGLWVGNAAMDTIMQAIYTVPLRPSPMRYSCLNFALLMDLEQRVTGEPHDTWVARNVYALLGAPSLMYNPLDHGVATSGIASTEKDPWLRNQLITGYVHDEMAAFSGGIQGNAGLFANATDLAKLAMMWARGGAYGGERIISEKTVKDFTMSRSDSSHRRLGFDAPSPDSSSCPEEASQSTYGHIGFTGTCMWVDPENDLIFIFLSNRVNPSRDNGAWNSLRARSRIFQLLYNAIQ